MKGSPSVLTREAGTSRPVSRLIRRRPSTSHVLIAIAVILAFAFNLLALQERGDTVMVAMAEEAIPSGTVLSPSSLHFVPIRADFEAVEDLITESEIETLTGWVVVRSIPAGGVLNRTSLVAASSGPGLRTMSVPVETEHAVGASLVTGDRIDVISVIDGDARFVAVDLEVVAVSAAERGSLSGIGDYHIVVGVDADQALELALAIDRGSLEVIRSTGASSVEMAP